MGRHAVQQTLRQIIKLPGIGLHSGRPARLTLNPAPVGHGIVFRRIDVADRNPDVPARFDAVTRTQLNTTIENADGVSVSTIEHLMAAFAGCGIHNALVEIDVPEVPIFDGSAQPFAAAIQKSGIVVQDAPLEVLCVTRTVRVTRGDAVAEIQPADGFVIDYAIDFSDAAIGAQSLMLDMHNGTFLRELSDCRTFCRQSDVSAMQANGLALGGTYENAVVVDGDEVLSPGGFRRERECVRHKMLDAVGDLALAGAPLVGRFNCTKGGHALTNALLREVMAQPGAVKRVVASADMARKLPGLHLTEQDFAAVV